MKATYDTDGLTGAFNKDNMNNQFHSLFQGDSSPLRPRAQATPDMTLAVLGTPAESYYSPYWIGKNAPLSYTAGNSSAISAPSANPRIDILYVNSSGALAWVTGTEAASPAAPNFGLAGVPICYVYCKTTMTKIVNYEDKDANPTHGYIYQDIRPNYSFISAGARHAIVRGFELEWVSSSAMKVLAGTLYHDITEVNMTSNTSNMVLATGSNWWDSAVDSYAGGAGWCYLGVNPSGNVRFLGANGPNRADVSGNTDGTQFYWYDSVDTYWRIIGAVRINTSNEIINPWTQVGNKIWYHGQIQVSTSTSLTWTDADCSIAIPAISRFAEFGGQIYHASDTTQAILIRENGTTLRGTSAPEAIIYLSASTSQIRIGAARWCTTDASQVIEVACYSVAAAAAELEVSAYELNIR